MTADEQHELYEEYYGRVVAYLNAKFQFTLEEARDLAQDVFFRVFSRVQEVPNAPWLFLKTAAHNRAVNEIRTRRLHRKTSGKSAEEIPDLQDRLLRDFFTDLAPASPETEAISSELQEKLCAEIENLPASLRSCVLLWLNALSYEQIAAALRITTDAVRTRLRDARQLLRTRMGGGR